MTIPILHEGRRVGVIETRREGAYTRFEAHCAFFSGVRRLYLFGGGRSAALGVMQPEGGELALRRRLSRAALRALPGPIEYAALEEGARPAPAEPPRPAAAEAGVAGGFFVDEDGARYLALPCALRRAVPGTRVREIGGRRWLLFRC